MNNENRIIYLTKNPEKKHEVLEKNLREKLYSYYNIPANYQNLFTKDYDHVEFSYNCPYCDTTLKGEWHTISHVQFDVKEEIWGDSKPEYHLVERRIYLNNFSQHDYSKAKEIEKSIKSTLHSVFHAEISKEIMDFLNMTNCPICGAHLKKSFPFFIAGLWDTKVIPHWVSNDKKSFKWIEEYEQTHIYTAFENQKTITKYFEFIKNEKEKIRKEFKQEYITPILTKHTDYLQSCDIQFPQKALDLSKSLEFLKEYLINLINLETNIICLSKRLKELYLLNGENDKKIAFERGFSMFNLTREIEQKKSTLIELKKELKEYESKPVSFVTVKEPVKPKQPEMRKSNFFNRKKIEALNSQDTERYGLELKKYYDSVKKCQEQTEKNRLFAENQKKETIEKYKKKIDSLTQEIEIKNEALRQKREASTVFPSTTIGKKHILDAEIVIVEEALKKNYQCRNELYSYNVIFDKYRNIIAISSFYEYLMAGRCDSLEGMNGAYSIYENESRMDSIITKLDEIENKLEEIKSTQFMIYKKLNSIESSLNQLNSSMEKSSFIVGVDQYQHNKYE